MRYPHWQFFESIDDELHSLSRIIEFSPENFQTFSVHLARLYLSICSEVDVIAKLLCARIASSETPKTINEYRSLVTKQYAHFSKMKVEMPSHELIFEPWSVWSSSENPKWWKSYNNVNTNAANTTKMRVWEMFWNLLLVFLSC